MTSVNEQCAVPDPLLSPGAKTFLEGFALGRWGLRAGRATRHFLRNVRDPIHHKIWMGRFVFPVRNLILRNRPVTIDRGGISVQMVPEGLAACETWSGLRCERPEVSLILSFLEPGMTFFDVGANAGVFAVVAAKKIGDHGIFALEPCASTLSILKRNLQLNQVCGVHVAQIVLGDSIGGRISEVRQPGNDGLDAWDRTSRSGNNGESQERAPTATLDAFIKEHHIPRVDVIRASVDGAELKLFRGAKELLQRADAPVILYEGFGNFTRGFGYHPVEILWFLDSCGYDLFTLNSDTGEIANLMPDYQYNSVVIAAKPSHTVYRKLRGVAE